MATSAVSPKVGLVHVVLPVARETILGKMSVLGIGDRLLVAILARQILVSAVQRKLGLPVMIEQPQAPTVGVVALLADKAEAPLMGIVLLVASIAGQFRILEFRGGVALRARNDRMQADEGKLGHVVAEGDLAFPGFLGVTLFAALPFLFLVGVVFLVAGDAFRFQLFLIKNILVTGVAFDLLVCTAQGIFGVLVVVENGLFPIRRGVAAFALLPETPLVFVVFAMAGITAGLQFLVFGLLLVATLAFDGAVAAFQLEFGVAVMIEIGLFPPIGAMTILAFLPELARMDVIHPVAGITLFWRVLVTLTGMAALA